VGDEVRLKIGAYLGAGSGAVVYEATREAADKAEEEEEDGEVSAAAAAGPLCMR
jgi:hypothetical protein